MVQKEKLENIEGVIRRYQRVLIGKKKRSKQWHAKHYTKS
jgi:hypothetical protein